MTYIEIIAFVFTGFSVGVLTMYFSQQKKIKNIISSNEIKRDEFKNDYDKQLQDNKLLSQELDNEKKSFVEAQKRWEKVELEIKQELECLRSDLSIANNKVVRGETESKYLSEKLKEKAQEIDEINQRLKTEFENIASKILKENSKELSNSNSDALKSILTPFKDSITGFEKKVEDVYERGLKEQVSLKLELSKLHELNVRIIDETNNLTNALTSDNKKQGNWGELVLEKVLERSGLKKGVEFFTQESFRDIKGEIKRPDVVITLPDEKNLIIDAKVSLTAYERFVNCENSSEKAKYLKQHIESIRNHIKQLSDKSYFQIPNLQSPDFTLLFLPLESAFSLALQEDSEIFGFAWEKRIVIVSPTTLLATLQTVASIWKYDKQNKNVIEIADRGGRLIDKFYSLIEDLDKMGAQLSTVNKTYETTMKKIRDGNGNLISQVEKLKELGAKASKRLPKSH